MGLIDTLREAPLLRTTKNPLLRDLPLTKCKEICDLNHLAVLVSQISQKMKLKVSVYEVNELKISRNQRNVILLC